LRSYSITSSARQRKSCEGKARPRGGEDAPQSIPARIACMVGNLHRPESLQRQDLLGVTRAEQSSSGTKTTGSGSPPTNGLKTGKN
jgi:hypothetical protein